MIHSILRPYSRQNLKPLFRAAFAWAMFVYLPADAVAHEFWIQASDYMPKVGEVVSLTTNVGQDFVGKDVPNIEEFYTDYSVLSAQGRSPVLGSLATNPPAYIDIEQAGTYIVGHRTERSYIEIKAEKFSKYLESQSLDSIFPLMKARGLHGKLAKEVYSRCIKTIIQTNDAKSKEASADALLSTPLGYTLELIPLSNPAGFNPGDIFKLQLLYDGQALENAKLTAINKTDPEQKTVLRTDAQGMAAFELSKAGVWMIHGVHMIPVQRYEAVWESFWANLTFQIN